MEYSLEERRRQLYHQIREWNVSRLDLFSISEPNQVLFNKQVLSVARSYDDLDQDKGFLVVLLVARCILEMLENLEFYGVMRFYYQDDNRRVSTKCIRVASSATTVDVILSLIEKFRPDLRMLSHSQYGLYEVHASGEERRLGDRECPLLVQLHWGRDDLEGRFLLKKETARTAPIHDFGSESSMRRPLASGVNRRPSTKEKKLHQNQGSGKENDAERLYQELPDSNFTRSISNPEIVMQKRRQAKLQKKLEEICSSEWGPDSGGTLKIYGQTICGELPYKTLLLSLTDNALSIVKETLEKYKLEKEHPKDYCLVKVISPNERYFDLQHEETVLNDYDCPLNILQDNPQLAGAGCITFHLRRRSDMANWKSGFPISDRQAQRATPSLESLPFLVEVNPDGTRPHDAHSFTIPLNGLEIGRERNSAGDGMLHLQLTNNDILPRHCIITCHGNVVTITPYGPDALVVVNNCRVYDRAVLEHGMMILLGRMHFFQFHDPIFEHRSLPVNRALSLPVQNESPDLLPAILEYREEEEDQFLSAIIPEVSIYDLQFKLMPAYLTYMTARFAYRAQFLSSPSVRNRSGNMTLLCSKVVFRIYRLIQMSQNNAGTLAFWMANSSELLNFLFRDQQLNIQTLEVREQLADCVHMAFTYLVRCVREKLNQAMPMFFETGLNASEASDAVTNILSSVMSLLLTTSVNAALTIQLFSQMFHFINMWLFNCLVKERQLCTREWGKRLRSWLHHIEVWSESQGLELAAECHLARIIQTAVLLELPKRTADDITVISSSCFKLNSLQLRRLLENFIPAPDEPKISLEFIDGIVSIAQKTADETARSEDQEIHLLEDPELRLPFLMPDDGYSCEFIKGILEDMVEYIKPLAALGICRLIVNRSPQNRQGLWTVHFLPSESFDDPESFPVAEANRHSIPPVGQVPEVTMVSFRKMNESLGLSIVAAIGEGQSVRRIFIKSVVPGGAAAADGRLQAGDELLEVDGQSLTGMTQEAAADAMSCTGQIVTLKVAKQSALYYDLATKLSQQSPSITSSPSFSRGNDPGDGTLRGQQGFLFHQTQPPSLGVQPIASGPARSIAANYPPQHLHHSQPTFGRQNLENPSSGNDEAHVTNAHAAPTGGRYSRTINRSSFGHAGPVRSKSVPDFDRADSGTGPRVVSSGRTLPRELRPGDSVYQPGRSGGDSLKRPILYPSTREVYGKGNYPPMGPNLAENGPKAAIAAGVSFDNRQYGRSGRPTNPVVGIPQDTQPFSPSRQTNVFDPSEDAPRPQRVNGQPKFYDSGTLDRDPRSASAKGSGLTRYPNFSGLDRIGLGNQQEQNIRPRHQTTGFRGFPDHGQPDVVHSSSSSVSHHSHPAHKGQPWYPSQRMELVEEHAPPVPPLPSNIYASVSRGSTNQNMMRVGPGPANPVKGYQESAWTSTKFRDDSRLQRPSIPKEPEYARVQQRTGALPPPPPLVTRSVVVSPWVREEKETETKKLEVEKRQIRENEILELELRRRLTSEEEEKLKRLKLEAEFDRRLEEVSNRETQDDDTEMTPAGRAKLIRHYQQEYELKRQQREEEHLRQEKERLKEQERRRQGQQQQQQNFEQQRLEEKNWEMQRQEQHLKQMEDYNRKQQELRAKHLMQLELWYRHRQPKENERLREEMRKRLKGKMTSVGINQMYYPPKGSVLPQRPAEPVEETYSVPRRPHQVFKTPPQPPERNSSFEVYRTGNALVPTDTGIGSRTVAMRQPPIAKKSVSFQTDVSKGVTNNQFRPSFGDLQQIPPSTFPAKIPQDLSHHVGGANISKNSAEPATPFSPSTDEVFTFDRGIAGFNYQRQDSTPVTPGVVGAQERYLDPRERLAAAKLANALTTGSYMTPERMSFRDKMKRFASETGEETPKDRPKISRAQQRLEADLSIQ